MNDFQLYNPPLCRVLGILAVSILRRIDLEEEREAMAQLEALHNGAAGNEGGAGLPPPPDPPLSDHRRAGGACHNANGK